MTFYIDPSQPHHIASANSHTYTAPTEALYIDRTIVYHDFIYLIDGEWLFSETIDDQEVNYLLKPGDVLILSAGNHHYTRLPCKAGTRTLCIHVCQAEGDMDASRPGCVALASHLNCKSNRKVLSLFKQIVDIFWSDDPNKAPLLTATFTLLACELASAKHPGNSPSDIRRAIQLINESPHKTFSTDELSALLGIPPRKLTHQFREETGETLRSYQISRKLEMIALQLQIEPDIRLKELAATFGFYDEFYLSKQFKKKYGVSPAQYRNA